MNNSPLVSVLMTAYNRERYVAQAIESVLASTYEKWELIIVDDGSKDSTVNIAKSYEAKDNRIKVYINEKNLGDYPNRNEAAIYANGEYLKYLDADDIIYPFSLEIMVDAMENNTTAAMAISQNIIDDLKPYPILAYPAFVAHTHFLQRGIINAGPSAAIIRTEIFKQLGGFSGRQYIGDTELWMRIAFNFPILLLQPSLVWWRVHPDQQILQEKTDDKIIIVRYQLNKSFIQSTETPLTNDERSLALKKLNRRLIVNIVTLFISKFKFSVAFALLKKSGISPTEFITATFH